MIWFKVMITCVIIILCLGLVKTIWFEDVPADKLPKPVLFVLGVPLLVCVAMIPVSLLALIWTT